MEFEGKILQLLPYQIWVHREIPPRVIRPILGTLVIELIANFNLGDLPKVAISAAEIFVGVLSWWELVGVWVYWAD